MHNSSEPGAHARRTGRSIVLVAALLSALAAYLIAATVSAQGRTTTRSTSATGQSTTVTWDGKKGAEYADLTSCSQGSYWLWILTPGGNRLESATLTVTFASGATSGPVNGYFPGNGDGSIHFDVVRSGGDAVTGATASVTYAGSKPAKIGLTISHSYCTGAPSSSVPSTGAPGTGAPSSSLPSTGVPGTSVPGTGAGTS